MSDGITGWAIELNQVTIPHVKKYLENPLLEKVFFNASYDLEMLQNIGIIVKGKIHDVMIMHNLIDEEEKDANGKYLRTLKGLSVKHLAPDADKFEHLVDDCREALSKLWDKPKDAISYYDAYVAYPEIMVDYAASDTLYTMQLFDLWLPEISIQSLQKIYDIEMDCIRSIVATEMRGHRVDVEAVDELDKKYTLEVAELEQTIYELAGREFNINSGDQLVEVLESLGVTYTAVTDKGGWSTNEVSLQPYLDHDDEKVRNFVEAVLQYRELYKTLNTFIKGVKRYTQADGKVHVSFWQAGTRTGRMSSSKLNLQNITKKTDDLRKIFMADHGCIIAYFDYCQQEYRLLAHYAHESRLIEMIMKGYDVHKATAALLLSMQYEDVDDDQRQLGKRMNFALVYGLGLAAIAKNFGVTIKESMYKAANAVLQRMHIKPWKLPQLEIILGNIEDENEKEAITYFYSDECIEAINFAKKKKKEYFAQFPNIEAFLKDCRKVCERRGWIRTWSGRRKRYDDPKREAYKEPNALIQGGCGDILKQKAAAIQKFLEENSHYNTGIINYIHDEIQVEVDVRELHLLKPIKAILDDNPQFSVPITCDFHWTDTSWYEKTDDVELLKRKYGEAS